MLLTEYLLTESYQVEKVFHTSSETVVTHQAWHRDWYFQKKKVQFREVRLETRKQGQVGRSVRCGSERFPDKFHTKVKLQSWCGSTSCKCCLEAGVCTGIQSDHVG